MIVRQTNLNLVYPKITEYRKKIVLNEDVLSEHFMPPMILPVPEQMQDEVSRVLVQTKNGHSVLNIALSVASFATNYDGDFVNNWTKCRDYLNARCTSVYDITSKLTDGKIIFTGLITDIEIDDCKQKGVERLKSSLLKENAGRLDI